MTRHLPIEIPVGPMDCIDGACDEIPEGAEYCAHVIVLVLCEACSGWTEQHGVKNEALWSDCYIRDEMRKAATKLHDLAEYIRGDRGELAYLADPVAKLLTETAKYTHPMTASQQHLWTVAASTALTTNGKGSA
jgi:hypothetical protein